MHRDSIESQAASSSVSFRESNAENEKMESKFSDGQANRAASSSVTFRESDPENEKMGSKFSDMPASDPETESTESIFSDGQANRLSKLGKPAWGPSDTALSKRSSRG